MAIALVISADASNPVGVNGSTTSAVDTTGATLLVVAVPRYTGGGAVTVSDSNSNTWVQLTLYGGADPGLALYYVKNPTVGSGHTFSCSGSGIYAPISMQAFSVTDTTANVDQQNGASSNSPGSITPSVDNCVVVTAFSGHGGAPTVDAGFTLTTGLAENVCYRIGMAYKVQTTAAAINATWSSGSNDVAVIASFKPAGGGAPANTTNFFQFFN